MQPIINFGSREQKEKYIPKLASGEWIGAFGLTEPHSGSDAGLTKTFAARKGDKWIINGTKSWCTNGAVSDVLVFTARTEEGTDTNHITSFIVEKGTPGLEHGRNEKKLGLKGSVTSVVYFKDLELDDSAVLGDLNKGYRNFLITLDGGRIGIGAMAVGLAQAALEQGVKFSQERIAFGQPISQFQGIQWMLSDAAAHLEAARQLIYHAAELKVKGLPYKKEAAMAKLVASRSAMDICRDMIQVHGGYGYSREYPVERIFRDCKLTEIGEGTSEILRLVIARELLKGN